MRRGRTEEGVAMSRPTAKAAGYKKNVLSGQILVSAQIAKMLRYSLCTLLLLVFS